MVITAHAGGSFAAASLPPFSTGVCTFVDTVVGIEKEEGQDRLSVLVSFFSTPSEVGRDQQADEVDLYVQR